MAEKCKDTEAVQAMKRVLDRQEENTRDILRIDRLTSEEAKAMKAGIAELAAENAKLRAIPDNDDREWLEQLMSRLDADHDNAEETDDDYYQPWREWCAIYHMLNDNKRLQAIVEKLKQTIDKAIPVIELAHLANASCLGTGHSDECGDWSLAEEMLHYFHRATREAAELALTTAKKEQSDVQEPHTTER